MSRRAAGTRQSNASPSVAPSNSLTPGAAWNGTLGSGGAPPAENQTPLGTGSVLKAIGNFDQPLIGYLTADLTVTVVVDTAEAAWIKEVQFWLEGNTVTIPASQQTVSSTTGAVGYATVLRFSAFSQDGDLNLYAYIRPNNGLERRIGPIQLTAVGTGVSPITRPVRYLDPAGSDANTGLSAASPWKSVLKACLTAPAGAIVNMATGTYLEDSNTGSTVLNTRPITFQPSSGNLGDVTISRTSRFAPEYRWQTRAQNIIFNKIKLETSNICQVVPGAATSNLVWINCTISDTNGRAGPAKGFFNGVVAGSGGADYQGTFFKESSGEYHAFVNCSITMYQPVGWAFQSGCTVTVADDCVFLSNVSPAGYASINNSYDKRGNTYVRYHYDLPGLTVASVAFTGGRTVITWNSYTGTSLSAGQSDPTLRVRFLTGTLAGQGSAAAGAYVQGEQPGYSLYANDSVAFTTTLQAAYGDMTGSIHAGDTAWVAGIDHPDMGQTAIRTAGQSNYDNISFQRNKYTGDFFQNVFLQEGSYVGAGTVTTLGVNGTCSTTHGLQVNDFVFLTAGAQAQQTRRVTAVPSSTTFTLASAFTVDQTVGVAWQQAKSLNNAMWQLCSWNQDLSFYASQTTDQGQWQHGHTNVLMRQCTFLRMPLDFRTNTAGFSLEGCLIKDCVFDSVVSDSSPGFPPSGANGVTIDTNHFSVSPARGTNSELATAAFDANLKPTSGVALTTTPKLKWDRDGNAYKLDGTALVGAVAA